MVLVVITSIAISSCSDENIRPADGSSDDPCQFGGPGCPKLETSN